MTKEEPKPEIPKKRHFTVKVDATVPIQEQYSIWEFDEHKAVEAIKRGQGSLISISKPSVALKYITEIAVYIGGTINKLMSVRLK